MHTALKNLWASVAIDAGAVLDRDRSGAGDLTLETSGLRPTDRSRPSDLTLAGWGGAACDYMIDLLRVRVLHDPHLEQRSPLVHPGNRGDRGGAC
eukprot:jgi/Tetstr1/442885/TSEL_030948.t1